MKQELTFSGEVKEELSKNQTEKEHCYIAEIAAIISMCGKVTIDSRERYSIKVRTENVSVARKYFTLLRKTFNIDTETLVSANKNKEHVTYTVIVKRNEDAMRVLKETKLMNDEGDISEEFSIIRRPCCKRAYLRGAFLAAGSISNPEKSYHIEIVCATRKKANHIRMLINGYKLDAKVILRKNSHIVYLKEGSQIIDLLNIMEAPISLMKMENVRILKEMRNTVNRKVNCETANINKTVSAAAKQAEDIEFIHKTIGLGKLPDTLQEVARLRLVNPEASLKELAELCTSEIGKSGINHRLRKLSEIAEELRESKEEQKW
ncbi:MAG: DNA-binding protein WhiA [Lachnospiraceae bacterium]|nr:DNA-binding protein WhiA [Lachnospiraceae bacterium]